MTDRKGRSGLPAEHDRGLRIKGRARADRHGQSESRREPWARPFKREVHSPAAGHAFAGADSLAESVWAFASVGVAAIATTITITTKMGSQTAPHTEACRRGPAMS
jgi:hypothetical protein